MIPLILVFFFKILLGNPIPVPFNMNFRINLFMSIKEPYWDCDRNGVEPINKPGRNSQLYDVDAPNP